jgi:olefin beta-lactone synthetase
VNVADILAAQARRTPDAPAIIDLSGGRERKLSFSALDQAAARAANSLIASGLRPGDAVLVLVPMSLELYVALAALFRAELVAMFIDPSAGLAHIARCCELRAPAAMIGSFKALWLRLVSPSLRQIPRAIDVRTLYKHYSKPLVAATMRPVASATLDAPALLTFTSGSTGEPKAALRTHGFLEAQLDALRESLELSAGSVDVATMPIVLLADLACGVTSIIPGVDLRRPSNADPAELAREIASYGATSIVASPALLENLAAYCLERGVKLSGLKKIFGGGAPVFPRLLDSLTRAAPNAEVTAIYGSTEAEPIAHLAARAIDDADRAAMQGGEGLLAGVQVTSIDLKIVRASWGTPISTLSASEFAQRACRVGEVGEITVTGTHVLTGYLDGRGDEETKFRVDGHVWHRTGDLGKLDPRGRLWLLGRAAAAISDARGALYPFAVECATSFISTVRRSAVLGVSGKRVLVVELDAHVNSGDTLAQLRESLAWASLDDIIVMPRIPVDKRHNAKIDYPALRRALKVT